MLELLEQLGESPDRIKAAQETGKEALLDDDGRIEVLFLYLWLCDAGCRPKSTPCLLNDVYGIAA